MLRASTLSRTATTLDHSEVDAGLVLYRAGEPVGVTEVSRPYSICRSSMPSTSGTTHQDACANTGQVASPAGRSSSRFRVGSAGSVLLHTPFAPVGMLHGLTK